jgi:hypothetical protein
MGSLSLCIKMLIIRNLIFINIMMSVFKQNFNKIHKYEIFLIKINKKIYNYKIINI